VRNEQTGNILAVSTNGRGHPYVSFRIDGRQVKKGLALVICRTFIEWPRADFTTPIHFNGDFLDCSVANLGWRPRWFAVKYTQQFDRGFTDTPPVRNTKTGVVYDGAWDVVLQHGVLFNDVIKSIINVTYVFPLMECFEWANAQ
jgi:hypothetical protein